MRGVLLEIFKRTPFWVYIEMLNNKLLYKANKSHVFFVPYK